MVARVAGFTLHNDLGERVLAKDLVPWSLAQSPWRTFNVTSYSWFVDGREMFAERDAYWDELPDSSGFICFESDRDTDNCYILDAYGKLRYRLTVPCEFTPYDVPLEARRWFRSVGSHESGQFGVTAWIEYAGDFYFELDYHEGRFLWGKEIRF